MLYRLAKFLIKVSMNLLIHTIKQKWYFVSSVIHLTVSSEGGITEASEAGSG